MRFIDEEEAREWAEHNLKVLLKSMPDYELIDLSIRTGNYPEIVEMPRLDKYFHDLTHTEVIDCLAPGFNTADEWFYRNSDDLYQSFNSLDEVPELEIDIDYIMDTIFSEFSSFDNDDVQEILDIYSQG